MIAIVKYKERTRVVFILGQEGSKVYCLSSEKIPEGVAVPLSKILYPIKDLGSRIAILKEEYPAIYRLAMRVLDSKKLRIIEKYEQPK